MSWSGDSQEFDGHQFSGHPGLQGVLPIDPLPERLPWQVAALVILTLSLLLWCGVIAGVARLLG
jgi:predicted anti-sigma-YlaC factor YlaD